MTRDRIQVACGVIVRGDDILIARRPQGKIGAGKWEFPGGKIETGEGAREALVRELDEELGIRVKAAEPLARLFHDYSQRRICLDTWRVDVFEGFPRPREGQQLAWVRPAEAEHRDMLASSWRVLSTLRLPRHYVFTPLHLPVGEWLAELGGLSPGSWLRLRRPELDDNAYTALADRVSDTCREHGVPLVVDRLAAIKVGIQAVGVHLDGAHLAACSARPLGHEYTCMASVHDAEELARAYRLEMDAAVLSPLRATASHPGQAGLGEHAWQALARDAGLPVYALGGVGPEDLPAVQALGGFGVAGISAYWPDRPKSSEPSSDHEGAEPGSPAMR